MALYDHFAAAEEKQELENYNFLLKFIEFNPEFVFAHKHLLKMESQIKSLEGTIKDYSEFFNKLAALIPRQSTIYDTLI